MIISWKYMSVEIRPLGRPKRYSIREGIAANRRSRNPKSLKKTRSTGKANPILLVVSKTYFQLPSVLYNWG